MTILESLERNIASESLPPLLKISLPFSHRLNCFIRLWLFKSLVSTVLYIHRFLYPQPKSWNPTIIKKYPCRPTLETRIFFPPTHKPGSLLPLYINIHGGGFAVCDAKYDDEFCSYWAKRTGMLIVSLNYRKAPLHPFPVPVHDIATVAGSILNDETLPIDHSRVTIAGFSAGGNLALCAAQLPELKGRIKAAISYYPIVDFGHPPEHKLASRPYKNGPKDSLEASSPWFDWGYVSVGENRRNPILSPCYARKEDLPERVYIIGAQWDMLRLEAQDMIHELAGFGEKEDKEEDFEEGAYKWTLARGTSHGFTHHFGRKKSTLMKRREKCEEVYEEAHEWLRSGGLV